MGRALWTQQDPGIACTSLGTAGGSDAVCACDVEHFGAFPNAGLHHRHY